jgi:hypothetical protein
MEEAIQVLRTSVQNIVEIVNKDSSNPKALEQHDDLVKHFMLLPVLIMIAEPDSPKAAEILEQSTVFMDALCNFKEQIDMPKQVETIKQIEERFKAL